MNGAFDRFPRSLFEVPKQKTFRRPRPVVLSSLKLLLFIMIFALFARFRAIFELCLKLFSFVFALLAVTREWNGARCQASEGWHNGIKCGVYGPLR